MSIYFRYLLITALLFLAGTLTAASQGDSLLSLPEDSIRTVEEEVVHYPDERDTDERPVFLPTVVWDEEQETRARALPESLKRVLRSDKDFWYAQADFRPEKRKSASGRYTPVEERSWFRTLIWLIIIAGFTGFLILFLSSRNVRLFVKKPRAAGEEEEAGMPEDIFAIRYPEAINRAIREENYRLAVRLLYLQLLRDMANGQLIRYHKDKTNLDYLLQFRPHTLYPDFFRLTRHYEYAWYGKFPVSSSVFAVIQEEMDDFSGKIRRT